jgi:hypothetical protein
MYFARLRCFLALAGMSLTALAALGCRTGPLAEFYGYNPFYRMGEEETQYGAPPAVRREQIQDVVADNRGLSAEKRAPIAQRLAVEMQNEVDPLLRAEIVLALGELNAAPSADALRMAIKDNEAAVRIAACKAWKRVGGAEAVSVLSEVVASDTDDDVRLAATRCLGDFKDPLAVQGLAVALDDANPRCSTARWSRSKNVAAETWATTWSPGASTSKPARPETAAKAPPWSTG